MVERGHPAYRARQVLDWVIRRRAESFEPMSDLPKALRQQLDAEWTVFGTRVAYHDVAPDGTDKLVVECRDGRRIECVLMAEGPRRTVCISTQVGCGMGCVFCASGLKGVERNLDRRRDPRAGAAPAQPPAARGDGHATSSSWGWGRAWRTWTTWSRRSIGSARPRRGWGSASVG